MAAFIKKEIQLEAKLIPGEIGEFSVYWNGEKVVAKGDADCCGGFPTPEEVVVRIKGMRQRDSK